VTVAALGGPDARDAGDAANVATARLVGRTDLDTRTLETDTDGVVPAVLDEVTTTALDVLVLESSVGTDSRADGSALLKMEDSGGITP